MMMVVIRRLGDCGIVFLAISLEGRHSQAAWKIWNGSNFHAGCE